MRAKYPNTLIRQPEFIRSSAVTALLLAGACTISLTSESDPQSADANSPADGSGAGWADAAPAAPDADPAAPDADPAAPDAAPGAPDAAPSGTINSIDTIIYDMQGSHEALMHGVPADWSWGSGPRLGAGNQPGDKRAITHWGQVYGAATSSGDYEGFPQNTRIQVRNAEIYILSTRDNQWRLVQQSASVAGAAYVESFANDANIPADLRDEASGGISVKLVQGHNFHFWPTVGRADIAQAMGGSFNPATDIAGVLATFQARLVVDDPAQPDDRDQTKVVASCGADYWIDTTTGWLPDWSANADVGIGKAKYVTSNWKAFNMHSMTPDQVQVNPPPLE